MIYHYRTYCHYLGWFTLQVCQTFEPVLGPQICHHLRVPVTLASGPVVIVDETRWPVTMAHLNRLCLWIQSFLYFHLKGFLRHSKMFLSLVLCCNVNLIITKKHQKIIILIC